MILVAGRPLIDLFLRSLEAAGFEEIDVLIDTKESEIASFLNERESETIVKAVNSVSRDISQEDVYYFYGREYLEPRDVIRFIKFCEQHNNDLCVNPVSTQLVSQETSNQSSTPINMAYFPAGVPNKIPSDFNGSKIKVFSLSSDSQVTINWLWDLLNLNSILIDEIIPMMKGIIQQGATIIEPVLIEKGAIIRSGTYIEGPVIIGRDCVVGPNCFLRPGTALGNRVRVGNAVELKNSIIMDDTSIGHLSYVGDSIIGPKCNFGAGTKVANLRIDNGNFKVTVAGQVIDTGRRKLGVFLGENVKTGINCSLMGGVSVGTGAMIGPGTVIYRNVKPFTRVLLRQQTEIATK